MQLSKIENYKSPFEIMSLASNGATGLPLFSSGGFSMKKIFLTNGGSTTVSNRDSQD